MLELILEFLIHFIFTYPGAIVVWMFTGFRWKFKKIFKIFDGHTLGGIGLVFWGLVFVLICYILDWYPLDS